LKKPKVLISTNIAPLYVKPLWGLLSNSQIIDFDFIFSKKSKDGIETIDYINFNLMNLNWNNVSNYYIKKALIFQKGLIKYVYNHDYDVYIFSGEMYNISTWISSIICKIKGKKIVYWGHGYYGDERGLKKILRLLFYKIPDLHFLYGTRSKNILEKNGLDYNKLITVYNSLDYDNLKIIRENKNVNYLKKLKLSLFPFSHNLPILIFIGRLTIEKKIHLLLYSIHKLRQQGHKFNTLIVGDGNERKKLVDLTNLLNINEHINFFGSCYDDHITGNLLLLSDMCVSPGHVGLTAIHAMSLGVPVITHNNFCKQAPEVEAIKQGYTGFYFKENDVNDLSNTILSFIQTKKAIDFKSNCIKEIELYFTPANQYKCITSAIISILDK